MKIVSNTDSILNVRCQNKVSVLFISLSKCSQKRCGRTRTFHADAWLVMLGLLSQKPKAVGQDLLLVRVWDGNIFEARKRSWRSYCSEVRRTERSSNSEPFSRIATIGEGLASQTGFRIVAKIAAQGFDLQEFEEFVVVVGSNVA